MRTRGLLPIGQPVDCVRQIVGGLEAAQRIGILHREIKPSNCYIGEEGTVTHAEQEPGAPWASEKQFFGSTGSRALTGHRTF